jgi:hypothetical protein
MSGLELETRHRPEETSTRGHYIVVATCGSGRPNIELWLDKATGQDRFWYGFVTNSKKEMTRLIEQVPDDIAPAKRRYGENDWKYVKASGKEYGVYKLPTEKALACPYLEEMDRFYFGMYDWGGHASTSPLTLDIWKASDFICRVMDSVTNDQDDPEAKAFEGKARKLFILHRKREWALRQRKIRAVLDAKKRLICEVPNCEFDFAERYGKLGKGFAHVHHLDPLSKAPKKGTEVNLNHLAIVCANCHAMVHRGGECRPLLNLIP